MAHVAKRNPDRCPTHPGALLREDVIPATGKTKADMGWVKKTWDFTADSDETTLEFFSTMTESFVTGNSGSSMRAAMSL